MPRPAAAASILSKVDEAVKLAPALDAMIRHKLKVLAVANGQRVPEDWHRLSAHALVQRALRSAAAAPAWRLDAGRRQPGLRRPARRAGRADPAPRPERRSPDPAPTPACATSTPPAASRRSTRPTACAGSSPARGRARLALVANPHVAFCGVVLDRAGRGAGARWAAQCWWSTPPTARRRRTSWRALDLARLHRAAVAAGVLPAGARPAAAPRGHARLVGALPRRSCDAAAPQADVLLLHAERRRPGAPVRAGARCGRC